MQTTINSFRGDYFFLSNFYECPVTYQGITYPNNETAFQAQKCMNDSDKTKFMNLSPSAAKKLGRSGLEKRLGIRKVLSHERLS